MTAHWISRHPDGVLHPGGSAMRGLLLSLVCLFGMAVGPAQAMDLDAVSGVYKHRFKNSLVSGEVYDSENILELVKLAADTAYVRLSLQFGNGHTCSTWGIAHARGDRLVYANRAGGEPCELSLKLSDGAILLDDKDGKCRNYSCGARGGYEGVTFTLTSRRDIRYMERLKASAEFKEALDEDAAARK